MKRKMMIDKKKVFMAVGALSIGMAVIIACSTFNEYLCKIRQAHENEFPSVQQYGTCRRT